MKNIKTFTQLHEAEAWSNFLTDTEVGKIMYTSTHDHNSGLGYIKSALELIRSNDDISKEDMLKYLSVIEKGATKCRESADYLYKQLEEKEKRTRDEKS